MTEKNKTAKLDPKFYYKLREIMDSRYKNGLAKFNPKELGFAEATRLCLRAPSWSKVEEELKKLPKKEGIILKEILENKK